MVHRCWFPAAAVKLVYKHDTHPHTLTIHAYIASGNVCSNLLTPVTPMVTICRTDTPS